MNKKKIKEMKELTKTILLFIAVVLIIVAIMYLFNYTQDVRNCLEFHHSASCMLGPPK
jgi:cell division protein FtsL